jgi:sRNA-binding protein
MTAPATVRQVRKFLVERYPLTFQDRAISKRPLALTIRRDVIAAHPDIDSELIVRALKDYCGGPTYLRSIVAGVPRINLLGCSEGFVTRHHERHAKARLRDMARYRKDVAFDQKELIDG